VEREHSAEDLLQGDEMEMELIQTGGMSPATSRVARGRLSFDPLARVRAVVLLAGTVRPTRLSRSIGRSLMELPIAPGRRVIDAWQDQTDRLAQAAELPELPLRIMIDQNSCEPLAGGPVGRSRAVVERDAAAFRGTGGVLRDICEVYQEDDVVLVANGGQILVEPLDRLAQELSDAGGDVSLLAHSDGTPVGLMMVRCGVLRAVRQNGFMDFKEQVLPLLAERGDEVRVVRRNRATGVALRTLDGYIGALRAAARIGEGRPALDDPLDEDWRPTFSILEDGATVHPEATIHDSVVLSGATVERGAVVVRSVVCPGGIVRGGSTVADAIVGGRDRTAGRQP
jgi:hypothetical protein